MVCGQSGDICVALSPEDAGQPYVVWHGWGTSLAWFAHAVGACKGTREMICQLLFCKSRGLGLNIVRYNIGGACQDQVQQYRAGAAIPCFLEPDGTYNWDADAWQVSVLLAAAQLGADTFEAFVNSPPWHWTVSNCSRGHQHPLRNNLKQQHIQDYAKFCADVVAHFKSAHGITFSSLSPFNEPSSPAWCLAANCKQEACYFSRDSTHKVLHALSEQPSLQSTQLVAFDQFCVRDTLRDLRHTPKVLRPSITRVNTHTYDSSTFFHRAAKPLVLLQDNSLARKQLCKVLGQWGGVPLWVSEFGTGRGPFKLAKHVVKDIATLLPSAWVYWQAVEAADSGWGLLETPMQHPPPAGSATAAPVSEAAAARGAAAGAAAGDLGGTATNCCGARKPAEMACTVHQSAVIPCTSSSSSAAGTTDSGPAVQPVGDAGANGQPAAPGAQHIDKQQQQAAQVTLHPNYAVMHFLMQAVPQGSRVYRVKALGKRGFGVCRHTAEPSSQACWSIVYINPSTSKARNLQLSRDSIPLDLMLADQLPAAGGSGTVGRQAPVSPGAGPPRLCYSVNLLKVTVVQSLSVLQSEAANGSVSARLVGAWKSSTQDMTPDALNVVQVPAEHICRIDWSTRSL